MRKVTQGMLLFLFLLSLAGCTMSSSEDADLAQGKIAPTVLTESAQDVFDAFGMRDTSQMLSFNAPAGARSVEISVYRLGTNGTWASIGGGGLSLDDGQTQNAELSGTFAMQLREHYSMDIFVRCSGLYTFQTDEIVLDQQIVSSLKGFLRDQQEITLNTEIPVALLVYDDGTAMDSYSLQDYFESDGFAGMDLVQAVTLEFLD